jgi:hypothetical protein
MLYHAGIKKLDMLPAGTDGRKVCESVGIYSPDGEYLPLLLPVVTEGRPEEWLNRVEEAMFATTKKHLYKVLEESKGRWGHGLAMLGVICGADIPSSRHWFALVHTNLLPVVPRS